MSEIRKIDISELRLDAFNPRLPANIQGGDQRKLIEHLLEFDVLGELARSILDNGFFQHEPLIVVAESDGTFKVVEGNRRCSTLKVLVGDDDAEGLSFEEVPEAVDIDDETLGSLSQVPCLVVEEQGDVQALIGYRHISGLRPWGAEAKGRYIYGAVEGVAEDDDISDDPFRVVGRKLGSNALGVRNFYIAYSLLVHAQQEGANGRGRIEISDSVGLQEEAAEDSGRSYGFNERTLVNNRFGVLRRALNDSNVLKFIGYSSTAKKYEDVRASIDDGVDVERLLELFYYMAPDDGTSPVLRDSRGLSDLGKVLVDEDALNYLRESNDFNGSVVFLTPTKHTTFIARVEDCERRLRALKDELVEVVERLTLSELESCQGRFDQMRKFSKSYAAQVKVQIEELEEGSDA